MAEKDNELFIRRHGINDYNFKKLPAGFSPRKKRNGRQAKEDRIRRVKEREAIKNA